MNHNCHKPSLLKEYLVIIVSIVKMGSRYCFQITFTIRSFFEFMFKYFFFNVMQYHFFQEKKKTSCKLKNYDFAWNFMFLVASKFCMARFYLTSIYVTFGQGKKLKICFKILFLIRKLIFNQHYSRNYFNIILTNPSLFVWVFLLICTISISSICFSISSKVLDLLDIFSRCVTSGKE